MRTKGSEGKRRPGAMPANSSTEPSAERAKTSCSGGSPKPGHWILAKFEQEGEQRQIGRRAAAAKQPPSQASLVLECCTAGLIKVIGIRRSFILSVCIRRCQSFVATEQGGQRAPQKRQAALGWIELFPVVTNHPHPRGAIVL